MKKALRRLNQLFLNKGKRKGMNDATSSTDVDKEKEKEKEWVESLLDYPAIKKFARRLVRTPGQVESASNLLYSLQEGIVSPKDAFDKFWRDEIFKTQLVHVYEWVDTFRYIVKEQATEERKRELESQIDWVKDDPNLRIKIEDDAHLLRLVLSLSVVYWMDINLFEIVDLREVVPKEIPPDLEFEYRAVNKHDEEALKAEIEVVMGKNYDQAQRDIALSKISAEQRCCACLMPGDVAVSWRVSYCVAKHSVTFSICAIATPSDNDNVPA